MGDNKELGKKVVAVPPGDDRERLTCVDCGHIFYENPKIVVGSICERDGQILLVRRAINPRKGYWSFPGGFLELQESPIDGAKREAWEEARAKLDIDTLLAIYNIDRISQIQLIYRAQVLNEDVSAGPESIEVQYFSWEDLPWTELAFPTVKWALQHFHDANGENVFRVQSNPEGLTGSMYEKF